MGKKHNRRLFSGLAFAAVAVSAVAATDSPLWLRNAAISPDGRTLAFTYRGDIYTVDVNGGSARQLTSNPAYDTNPIWSPDGQSIAFSSDRNGSPDIYIMPAKGGTARRITTNSSGETPLAFLDNETLLFNSKLQPSAKAVTNTFGNQTYSVSVNGGRPKMYVSAEMVSADVNKTGSLLYENKKGYEDPYRKHERSARTGDIWMFSDGKFRQLTDFGGKSMNPVWISESEFAYISEDDGTLNVWAGNITDGSKRQLTRFAQHPVRGLSASADGKTLAFSWDGELYTIPAKGGEPVKVNVDIVSDDYDADIVKRRVNYGASNMAVAPEGDEVAFVLRGDIYATSVKYATTKRITATDGQERCLDYSPDGRRLVYDSERDGKWQLFISEPLDKNEKSFTYATDLKEDLLYSGDFAAQQPDFSPDGKKVAFLEDRTALKVIDVDTKKVVTALDGKYNYSYTDGDIGFEWSPDSNWLLVSYIGIGGWNNIDIALVKADGSEVVDLTESGYTDSNPKWIMDGKGIAYQTAKYGMRSHGSWGNQDDIVLMMLDGEAWDTFLQTEEEAALAEKAENDKNNDSGDVADDKGSKKKDKKKGKKDDKADKSKDAEAVKALDFELADRKYRTCRLTDRSASMGDFYVSPKGDKLYYVAYGPEGGSSLIERNLKTGESKTLSRNVSGALQPDKNGENVFVLSYDGMKQINLATGEEKSIAFDADYDRRPSKEREYIYDHMLRQVNDKFYDAALHSVDWAGYGEHYRKFLPHINNNADFAILMSEVLGELNASHTGARFYSDGAPMQTANLGAFFDEDYDGDGLKISEIIARGPLSTKKAGVKPGDVILAINGKEIKAGADYYPMLEGMTGRKVRLTVRSSEGKTKDVTVRPIGSGQLSELLYARFVEYNQNMVDSLSDGRLAYVHIQGMDSPSFRRVFDELLGKYRNREAVIVDTRWNGGGWLHNDVVQLLSGKEYVRFSPRGNYIGSEPFSQWSKPSVMLINEGNYSDAHATPYAYKTLGIGKLIGAPVPGTMTAVWWENQIDPSLVFGIPQVTSLDQQGRPLENQQLEPDIKVFNHPADVLAGRDAQIEAAVKELLNQLDNNGK